MDGSQFDIATRFFAHSRRSLLAAVLATTAGRLGISGAEAGRKRKHKKRKQKAAAPNEFGCISVGDLCQNADQCCSGICEGKKGKRTCRAHDTGTCIQGIPDACDADNPVIAVCNSDICLCSRTTAGSNFCANANYVECADCAKDADCEALGWPPGSACIPFSSGECAGLCEETGMACRPPCGVDPPPALASRRLVLAADVSSPAPDGDE